MLGLPYAFASHFAPQMMMEAIDLYRHRFEPSEQLDKPYVMLGFNAIVADTNEEAELLATSQQQAFVSLRTGNPTRLPPPKPGYLDELPLEARAMLRQVLSASAVGSPVDRARQGAGIHRTNESRRTDCHGTAIRSPGAAPLLRAPDAGRPPA